MKVIIAGSRTFSNYDLLKERLDYFLQNQKDITIISGNATGADRLGEDYAHQQHHKLEEYPAMWDIYGKSAGYRRNEEMAKIADCAVIFWDGKSKGTKHMIDLCKKNKIKLRVVMF